MAPDMQKMPSNTLPWLVILGLPVALIWVGLLYAGERWPDISVGACAVGVAAYFGYIQWKLGDRMQVLAARQGETQEILRRLTATPVLAPSRHPKNPVTAGVVMLRNCGNGPATDIRANVCRPGQDPSGPPAVTFDVLQEGRSHLGPYDSELRLQARQKEEPVEGEQGYRPVDLGLDDVWIIHCADLNGWHWHAWCNWTRDDAHRPGEPFMFDSEERTPPWVGRNCKRCKELGRQPSAQDSAGSAARIT